MTANNPVGEDKDGGLDKPSPEQTSVATKSVSFVRELVIYPGYDKRNADPSKNYGVHGCDLRFYVHNKRRTKSVQFVAYTCWLPPKTQEETMYKDNHIGIQPMGADLGYHSPRPTYKGQTRMDCDLSKRGYCYYDGSGLAADRVRDILLTEGSEGVWKELEDYWQETFAPEADTAVNDLELKDE